MTETYEPFTDERLAELRANSERILANSEDTACVNGAHQMLRALATIDAERAKVRTWEARARGLHLTMRIPVEQLKILYRGEGVPIDDVIHWLETGEVREPTP